METGSRAGRLFFPHLADFPLAGQCSRARTNVATRDPISKTEPRRVESESRGHARLERGPWVLLLATEVKVRIGGGAGGSGEDSAVRSTVCLKRTWVPLPVPTWRLPAIHNTSPRGI